MSGWECPDCGMRIGEPRDGSTMPAYVRCGHPDLRMSWMRMMVVHEPKKTVTVSETKLFSIEPSHLDGLRVVATRLTVASTTQDPMGPMGPEEMRYAAQIIMQAVRFAESLEALRGPGELYVHMTPKKEGA